MTEHLGRYVENDNISFAWGDVFDSLLQRGVNEIRAFTVTVKSNLNGEFVENENIRHSLDKLLLHNQKYTCSTVANTIFPKSLWNPSKARNNLYEKYLQLLPRIKKFNTVSRQCGLYFERLIDYGVGDNKINQLEYIISTRLEKNNHRRSALQACIVNPLLDHTHQPQRGFPCLQQISFTPISENRLSLTAYYPHQYVFDRAYGNYLGLCYLGQFIAHEMGMVFSEMNCVVNIATLGSINKTDLNTLRLQELIADEKEKQLS